LPDVDAITPLDAARVVVRTPPDPQTGRPRMELDVLAMNRRRCAQPQPGAPASEDLRGGSDAVSAV
jgi:hypothetical protein